MNGLRRIRLFLMIVWRPAYPPGDASWWKAHTEWALDYKTAWEVAGIVWEKRR